VPYNRPRSFNLSSRWGRSVQMLLGECGCKVILHYFTFHRFSISFMPSTKISLCLLRRSYLHAEQLPHLPHIQQIIRIHEYVSPVLVELVVLLLLGLYIYYILGTCGTRGSVVIKALCYKPEGRGFDTRWGDFLNVPNLRTRPWGLLGL
jgi:hypothetical protein